MWQAWVNVILGLWLVVSGFIPGVQVNWNMIIAGILIALLGFTASKKWPAIVAGIVGIWIFISGLVPSLIVQLNFIIAGIVVLILSLVLALQKTPEEPKTTA
ncbi:SPW repeat protein [Fidelibacter multiformis]|jgi:predicted membrane protein|uniref:SPW repeat domain-containing protein n=1 Tax=Fidelibacter multiformis TaxID=3377529 RepID=UPI0037DDDC26